MTLVGFAASLGATAVLLVGAVATGLRARRRAHLTLVALAVVGLVTTIVCAERLGRLYDLEAAGWITPVHLAVAKITTLAYLLPVVTGVRTLRDPRRRPAHRKAAFLVLGLTVLALVTGTWMLLRAEPLPAAP